MADRRASDVAIRYELKGKLDKDDPLGWLDHYKLSGRWIKYWLRDTLPKLPAGRVVRITIEVEP